MITVKNGYIHFKGGCYLPAFILEFCKAEFIQFACDQKKNWNASDEKELGEVYDLAVKMHNNDDIRTKSQAVKSRKHSGTNKTGTIKAD